MKTEIHAAVICAVFLGGAVGALLRHVVSFLNRDRFPYGTLLANVLASFSAGFIIGHFPEQSQDWLYFFALVGVCGSLSTYSSFAVQLFEMRVRRQSIIMLVYVTVTLCSGLLAAWVGMRV